MGVERACSMLGSAPLCQRNASVRPTLPGGPSSVRDCITLTRAGHPAPCAPTPYPGSTLHEPGAGVARWPRRRLAACRREADVGEEDTDFRRQSVSAHAPCITLAPTSPLAASHTPFASDTGGARTPASITQTTHVKKMRIN